MASAVAKEAMEALRDLAEGRVHRSRHGLVVDGLDLTEAFRGVLAECGYREERIRNLDVPDGVRFPAFLLRAGQADFGHVFREKFHDGERRTLFGSVVKDRRGDWEVLLTRRSPESVWVHLGQGAPFDEDRPSAL
jgi:hypothetical protein